MQHALIRIPHLALDGKRIAGTSVAIAVHILALLLLLLPMRSPPSRVLEETSMIVVPQYKRPPPLIAPPQPVLPITAPVPRQPTPPRQPDALDTSPGPVDVYVPPGPAEVPVPDAFEPPTTPAFARISADVAPAPPYPVQALRRHLGGVVTLRLRVDVGGRPVAAAIEISSGSKLLDDAALKFVLARWHFVPATQDGRTVEAEALVPISFVIDR